MVILNKDESHPNYTNFRSVRICDCVTQITIPQGHPALGITPFWTANSVVRIARKEINFLIGCATAQLQSQHRRNWNKTSLHQDVWLQLPLISFSFALHMSSADLMNFLVNSSIWSEENRLNVYCQAMYSFYSIVSVTHLLLQPLCIILGHARCRFLYCIKCLDTHGKVY